MLLKTTASFLSVEIIFYKDKDTVEKTPNPAGEEMEKIIQTTFESEMGKE